MCGIIGIIGQGPAAPQLIDALKRLEYRGYDSAGVATLEDGNLTRRRAEGKLKNLESRLAREPLQGPIGIGHTRWATHGPATEVNAHPQVSEDGRISPDSRVALLAPTVDLGPPERNFPLPVVIAHGVFAALTITLVVLTALGVGGS